MITKTTTVSAPAPRQRRLTPVPADRRSRSTRSDALRHARDARRHLQARDQRFAHLKRAYD